MTYKDISARFFGVEVEMSTDFEIVQRDMKKSKVFPPNTKYSTGFGKVETDGKRFFLMIDGSTETEFVTPKLFLESIQYPHFQKMVQFFNDQEYAITNDDGLHIHVDCADVHPDQVLTAWLYIESKIKTAFPYNRRKFNTYSYSFPFCREYTQKPLMHSFQRVKLSHKEKDHHAACSFFSYNSRKDVEFRFMEGSLNMKDIEYWIKFCLYFVEFAKHIEVLDILQESAFAPKDSFEDLLEQMDIKDKRLVKWLNFREEKFKLK